MPTTKFLSQTKTNKHFYILLLLSLAMIKFASSAPNIRQTQSDEDRDPFAHVYSCDGYLTINNFDCFNQNIQFKEKKYQINNFAKTENEDFLLQISEQTKYGIESTSRLFYGLTNEGRYYFSNKSSYSHEFNINIDEDTFDDNEFYWTNPIDNSKNLFVSIRNTPNKEKKYLFSINSYNSMVELYDLNTDNNNYIIWSFHKFFKLDPDDYYFPFDYELIEIKDRNEYVIVFIPQNPQMYIDNYILDVTFMKKFRLQSFDINAFEERGSITYQDYFGTIILNAFYMDDLNKIVVLYFNETYEDDDFPPSGDMPKRVLDNSRVRKLPISYEISYKFNLKFYDSNLRPLFYVKNVELDIELPSNYQGEDIFIKSLYLSCFGEPYAIFVYSNGNYDNFIFKLFYIDYNKFKNDENYERGNQIYSYNNNGFDIKDSPNDFVKVKDTQVAFMYISTDYSSELEIILIDLDLFDWQFYHREYYIDLENNPTQIKGFSYNNYLMFSSTGGIGNNQGYTNYQNYAKYLSMFMIFGYANGTDSTIDISQFLFKEDYNNIDNNFFWFLFQNLTIENNIFGYFPIGIIKLVHIPEEISISIHDSYNGEEYPLEGPFIGSMCSGYNSINFQQRCLRYDYIIKQNTDKIKTSEYYYIDYQYILVDTEFIDIDEMGGGGGGIRSPPPILERRLQDELNRNINLDHPLNPFYFGRINRLQFKLCHEYCETCYELDIDKDNHKCSSCLPEYQYDYLYFTNQTEKNLNTCVPEGFYYDTEEEDIFSCDEIEHKYYINTTNNKKICFPIEDECPSSYPLYNETTKECYYCDFDRFKNGECAADDLTMESCTECDFNCFVLGGCDFKDFNTSNDDFFQKIKSGGFLKNYTGDDGYLRMSNANGYGFHLTTVNNELNSLKEDTPKNHSIIDLKDCADLLRSQNGLDSEEDLVILKYENENPSSDGIDKGIQYEVYLPNSETKLDLSVCANTRITIYVPIELSERTQKVYDNMKKQGYNLFDPNDKFYRDICTPYKSIDGTDVVLLDRVNFYEQNKLICQKNCEFED